MADGDYDDDDMYEWDYIEDTYPLAVRAMKGWPGLGRLQRSTLSAPQLRQDGRRPELDANRVCAVG